MKHNIDITEDGKQHPFLTIIVASSTNASTDTSKEAMPYIGIAPYESNGKLSKSQIILNKHQVDILRKTLNAVCELI